MYEPTLFDEIIKPAVNIPLANRIDCYYSRIMPELTNREEEVLLALKEIGKPSTMHQIAKFMGRDLNTISGRFSKLVEKNKIKIIGKSIDKRSVYSIA